MVAYYFMEIFLVGLSIDSGIENFNLNPIEYKMIVF